MGGAQSLELILNKMKGSRGLGTGSSGTRDYVPSGEIITSYFLIKIYC